MPPIRPRSRLFKSPCRVVPWISKSEWNEVKTKIFSSKVDDIIWAINRIAVWKSRCPSKIPLGIEVTAAIARSVVMDMQSSSAHDSHYQSGNLVLMYGMALVRFINLVTEMEQTKSTNTPLHTIAGRMGINEWIVNIRHQITHTVCPSLPTLRIAIHESLKWIKIKYWESEAKKMVDDAHPVSTQDVHADFDLARTLLKEYQQLPSMAETSKCERAKEFQTVLLRNSNIIGVFLSEEFLLPRKEVRRIISEKDSLLQNVFLKWGPILQTIINTGNITLFHEMLIDKLKIENEWQSSWIVNWLISIMNAKELESSNLCIKHSTSNFIKQCQELCDWPAILKAAIQIPNKSTLQILPLLMEKNDGILSEKQQKQLLEFMTIYCEEKIPFNKDQIDPQDYQTLNNLQDIINSSPSSNENWKPYEDSVDWSRYPIGILPSQIGADCLNLDLPREVDELHHHDYCDWTAKASNQAQIHCELESDDDWEDLPRPDLEARLLIAKHTKETVNWSHEQLLNVANKIKNF